LPLNRPHHFNPGFGRNAIQIKIAAGSLFARKRACLVARLRMKKGNPSGPAGGGGKRRAFDDGGGRERKAGDVVRMKLTSRKI